MGRVVLLLMLVACKKDDDTRDEDDTGSPEIDATRGWAACDDPGEGIVACYAMNDGLADGTGNGHDGTVLGASVDVGLLDYDWSAQWPGSSRQDAALRFEGADVGATLPGSAIAAMGGVFTVEMWVKPESAGPDVPPHTIFSIPGAVNLQLEGRNDTPLLVVSTDAGGVCDGPLPDGANDRFLHVAIVSDAEVLKLYVNGQRVCQATPSGVPDEAAYLGSTDFRGVIDEVRLYDRVFDLSEVCADAAGVVESSACGVPFALPAPATVLSADAYGGEAATAPSQYAPFDQDELYLTTRRGGAAEIARATYDGASWVPNATVPAVPAPAAWVHDVEMYRDSRTGLHHAFVTATATPPADPDCPVPAGADLWHLTSEDAVTWSEATVIVGRDADWRAAAVVSPEILWDGDRFHLFFNGASGTPDGGGCLRDAALGAGHFVSEDGKEFTPSGDDSPVAGLRSDGILLWRSTFHAVGADGTVAVSHDGDRWTVLAGAPIPGLAGAGLTDADLTFRGTTLRLLGTCGDGRSVCGTEVEASN